MIRRTFGVVLFIIQRIIIPIGPRIIAMALWTAVIAIVGFSRGIPAHCEEIAREWNQRVIDAGNPTEWEEYYLSVFGLLAWVMTLVGWVILAWLTMKIVGWIW